MIKIETICSHCSINLNENIGYRNPVLQIRFDYNQASLS
ncbi:hypothetical protein CSC12_0970 [Klebsiella michiganensis]|nr:hypothetical protein CSC12_0970 [Klebsiella michiganensis]